MACLQRRRSSPLGWFKPAQTRRTSGEVNIPHFPPCSAPFCLQTLRRVTVGGSVKVTFAFLAKLTPHPSFITWAWQEAAQVYMPHCDSVVAIAHPGRYVGGVLLLDRSMMSPWSASAVLWICFLDWRAESPAERRRGPLWPFTSPLALEHV